MNTFPGAEIKTGLEVAIIGMAGRFPGARNLAEFWRNLRDGVESVSFFEDEVALSPGESARTKRVNAAAVLDDIEMFDAEFFGYSAREASIMDPQQRIFLECSWEAIENAGYNPRMVLKPVGVYAGLSMSTYLWNNLLSNAELQRSVGLSQLLFGNDKDYLCTRVSYKLNLSGPSLVIQSACSTSLVAVHMACQGLLSGDCDVALAGGVSVTVPQKVGYIYEEGGICSPDGHCRAFDAKAKGTVRGNGVGVVVLKRLADALADRDAIRAVILGTAVNNDGAQKVGYTAPSVNAQADVIRSAQKMAGVPPQSISYIETHGTATALGDSVEIAALRQAFGTDCPRSIPIASIKTNIGHLDAAAGIAGLIKTVLALEEKLLPPNLHFESANPLLSLDDSSFHVNRSLKPWIADPNPRRAGVSSFGIGGTNAHVVIEEATERVAGSSGRPWSVAVLSARSSAALEEMEANLLSHLTERRFQIADVAHTLQNGRVAFPYRSFAVARTSTDLFETLRAGSMKRGRTEGGKPKVVFLFPGQGSQEPNAGRGLYESESVFRDCVDRCATFLQSWLGLDIRSVLFPSPDRVAESAAALQQTNITQPALFMLEYALTRLWNHWGVVAESMIGHSIGEYVAATVSGVFSLEDALRIVAGRGQLMQELPPGGMLSVSMPADGIGRFLDPEVTIAAVNGATLCAVSGPGVLIDRLRERLTAEGIACRPLRTSHAFHSPIMESIAQPFRELFEAITLHSPRVPWISNLTGTWVREEQATDPDYWAAQLRHPVLFAQGLSELWRDPNRLFLEVGPGRTLTTIARHEPGNPLSGSWLSSLGNGEGHAAQGLQMGDAVGQLWLRGVPINWAGFQTDQQTHRIPLPGCPFERRRYWVEAAGSPHTQGLADETATVELGPAIQPAGEFRQARRNLSTPYVAAENQLQQEIAVILARILGFAEIGIDDGFFELGGDSLLAVEFTALLQGHFSVDVPLSHIFESPTVRGMAEQLEVSLKSAGSDGPASALALPEIVPDPANAYEPFPLTDIQHAYWLGRQSSFELGNVGSHVYFEFDSAEVDMDRCEAALNRLIRRHDMLRVAFLPDGTQRILADVPEYRIERIDLRGNDTEAVEDQLNKLRFSLAHEVFDPSVWPLFDLRFSIRDPKAIRLHIKFDYLVADIVSLDIFLREFTFLYERPEAELPVLGLAFRDYIIAAGKVEQTEFYRISKQYWQKRLADLPGPPQLPVVKSLRSMGPPRLKRMQGSMPPEVWTILKNRAARAGITPSMFVGSVFAQILAGWSASSSFTMNLTLFNRLPIHSEVGAVMGDFTSTTLLEVDPSGSDFESFAKRVQAQLGRDLAHRAFSGVRVLRELSKVRGSGATSAAMPVVFTSVLTNALDFDATPAWLGPQVFSSSQSPQILIDHQVGEGAGSLVFVWDTLEDAFPDGVIDSMFEAYRGLLRQLAEDEASWAARPLVIPDAQLARRAAVNDTDSPLPATLLHTLFESQVALRPNQTAVISSAGTMTYQELHYRALGVGAWLAERGAKPNQLVAVVMKKGPEQVIAVLGVLDAGAAYFPIDPDVPADRLRYLLTQGNVTLALTQPFLEDRVEWPVGIEHCCIAVDSPQASVHARLRTQAQTDLAYVIYTSGSTGLPKGVMIDHRGAVNTVLDINERFGVGPADRILAVSSLAFDLSVYDIFGPLAAGAAIVMPDAAGTTDPAHWFEIMRLHEVTIWNSVPALMELLVEQSGPSRGRNALRLALLSGDWIPLDLPEKMRRICPGVQVISLGGATEASIWSIVQPVVGVDPAWRSIPYGRPLRNQKWHVLSPSLDHRPDWVPGELFISGIGVAKGYWRDEERTAQRFLVHPDMNERMYRTGDVGRYMPDGSIELLGRVDNQVKIRGYRIELGEIEATLRKHPAVADAVVVVDDEPGGARRLVAFAKPRAHGMASGLERRQKQIVESWETVFDSTYAGERSRIADSDDFSGWNSAYTGEPLPAADMREWIDASAARLQQLAGRQILEIGSGTGLLLRRLAGQCEYYCATDVSATAIDRLTRLAGELRLGNVEFMHRPAHCFEGFAHASFDTVILNSVAQYFPGIGYLVEVLQAAAALLKPNGCLFIGDLRNHQLLSTFWSSVLFERAGDATTAGALRRRLQVQVAREKELVIDPAFFARIAEILPAIGRVSVQLRRGRAKNELSRYRYDAMLFSESRRSAIGKPAVASWDSGTDLRDLLDLERSELVVRGIPNARLCRDRGIARWIEHAAEHETVSAFRLQESSCAQPCVDPEDIWDLAGSYRREVEIGWQAGSAGDFEALFRAGQESAG